MKQRIPLQNRSVIGYIFVSTIYSVLAALIVAGIMYMIPAPNSSDKRKRGSDTDATPSKPAEKPPSPSRQTGADPIPLSPPKPTEQPPIARNPTPDNSPPAERQNEAPGNAAHPRQPPSSFWGFPLEVGGQERNVKVSIVGLIAGSGLESLVHSYLRNTFGAIETNIDEFHASEVLTISVDLAEQTSNNCAVEVIATVSCRVDKLPPAHTTFPAMHVSHGQVCIGNDKNEATNRALEKALNLIDRNIMLSLLGGF